jgi:hypothetical protein
MKESVEEFGAATICCVVGFIVIFGLSTLIAKSGVLAQFADAYANYFYGASA